MLSACDSPSSSRANRYHSSHPRGRTGSSDLADSIAISLTVCRKAPSVQELLDFWQASTMLAVSVAATCSLAAARAALKSAPLVVPASQSISSERFRVSPDSVDSVVCLHLPGGVTAMALTVASGGTAGDIN